MLFAVVRVRGTLNVKKNVAETLKMLRLNKQNHCVLVKPEKSVLGMLKLAEKYVTWGEISNDVMVKILTKRAKATGNKKASLDYLKDKTGKSVEEIAALLTDNNLKLTEIPGMKPIFRLKPPSKGFGRVGVKYPFSLGGVFGYRGEKINELLVKMI
ncbi:MAG TPA: 50S ribosomal protein L30 [Candidatus Woesearchaeota archaeon]|nr:50S ribosomal protein L30 [Candidatus Woesearchaeota archaeon]